MTDLQRRWVQLTYTSYDPPGVGVGGWQVKQVSAHASELQRSHLLDGLRTRLDPDQPLPRFPTPEQREELPRRLVHRPTADGHPVYWHTLPVGLDSSGRPGNVFVHGAYAVADAALSPEHRPIDAWRSPLWLSPWGADAVLAARFHETAEIPPGPLAGRRSALAYLGRPGVETSVLGPLVDAVSQAIEGKVAVALIADSADEGARWLAVVSQFLSPSAAAHFSWSTYERVEALDVRADLGVHAAVFPPVDGPGLTELADAGSIALLDTRAKELPSDREFSDWVRLVQNAYAAAPDTMLRILAARDDIDAARPPGELIHPAWPLASAMRTDEDFSLIGELIDAVMGEHGSREWGALASRSMELSTPHVPDTSTVSDAIPAWVSGTGLYGSDRLVSASVLTTPEELWKHLSVAVDVGTESHGIESLATRYVEAALYDRNWLFDRIPRPAPPDARWHPSSRLYLEETAEAVLANDFSRLLRVGPVAKTLYALRMADFLVRARIVSPGIATNLTGRLRNLLTDQVPTLIGPDATQIRAYCELDPRTRYLLVQDVLWEQDLLARDIPAELHEWLGIDSWTDHAGRTEAPWPSIT